jgi:hypothetical protein
MMSKPQESSFCIDWTVFCRQCFLCGGKLCISLFFFLYVGVAALEFPQVCNCGRLLFGIAPFFFICSVVGYAFFSTRPA